MEDKPKKDYFLPISILIAAILISGSLIYSIGKNKINEQNSDFDKVNLNKIDLKNFSYLGDSKAKVTIIEYSDYKCPFCIKFHLETFPLIKENYIDKGLVKFYYKDLAFLSEESKLAALATRCAEEQNKFWEFNNKIFKIEYEEDLKDGVFDGNTKNANNLKEDLFLNIAQEFNLDLNKFQTCLKEKKYENKIDEQLKEAVNIFGQRIATPSFIINGKIIQGALPYIEFEKIIKEELNK